MLDYIPDGYYEPGFVAAVSAVHGDFRFEYRPMLSEERASLLAAQDTMDAAKYERKCGHEIAKRIRSWSLKDPKGEPVPPSGVTVLQLKPKLWGRVFGIVTGLGASDLDPEWKHDKKDQAASDDYESAITGATPGDVRLEANAKN